MSNHKTWIVIAILLMALLVACGQTPAEPGTEGTVATATPEITEPTAETPDTESGADAATVAAIAHLAQELGIAEADIELISVEAAEFNDSCLGLGRPDESCLQAITPGWRVILSANGQEYEVRTDETGAQVRTATGTEGAADPDAATAAAIAQLAQELGIAEGDIEVVSFEAAEFNDSCLGLGGPEESCLQAITPGWLVILSAEGQEYEVRTDAMGQQARVAPESGSGSAADPDAASAAAVAQLASELGVAEADIEVVSLEAAEFSDSCLGLGGPEESCLQAITPGWLLILSAEGQEYEVHTDETGGQVRIASES